MEEKTKPFMQRAFEALIELGIFLGLIALTWFLVVAQLVPSADRALNTPFSRLTLGNVLLVPLWAILSLLSGFLTWLMNPFRGKRKNL